VWELSGRLAAKEERLILIAELQGVGAAAGPSPAPHSETPKGGDPALWTSATTVTSTPQQQSWLVAPGEGWSTPPRQGQAGPRWRHYRPIPAQHGPASSSPEPPTPPFPPTPPTRTHLGLPTLTTAAGAHLARFVAARAEEAASAGLPAELVASEPADKAAMAALEAALGSSLGSSRGGNGRSNSKPATPVWR